MGRDNILPRKLFGHLDPKSGSPIYNVALVGIIAYFGALTLSWERAVEILNFGALLAFMAVNLSALRHFGFSAETATERNLLLDIIAPLLGFFILPGDLPGLAAIHTGDRNIMVRGRWSLCADKNQRAGRQAR
jgi:putrescine importer